jgi:adenine/guanine/hypoxanthine permease
MAQAAKDINWRYMGDAIPAFLTIAIMPFTYSIAYGLIAGILSYAIINTLVYIVEKASGGRIVPPNKDEKEPWTWRIPGGVLPPWLKRAFRGKKDFWRADERNEGVMREEVKSVERESADHETDMRKGATVGEKGAEKSA